MYFCGVFGFYGKRCIVVYWAGDYYDGIPALFYADVYDGAEYGSADYDVFPIYSADCVDASKWVWNDFDTGVLYWDFSSGGVGDDND